MPATLAQQLQALNSAPATRTVLDKDEHVIESAVFPNRAAAQAAPVPEGCSVVISVNIDERA